jgi:hypothetical protein
LTGMYCAAAVFGALVKAIPGRVMADSCRPSARPVFASVGPAVHADHLSLWRDGGAPDDGWDRVHGVPRE